MRVNIIAYYQFCIQQISIKKEINEPICFSHFIFKQKWKNENALIDTFESDDFVS